MNRIGAVKFKEQCLSLLERLTPEGLIITKRGKPVARLLPYPQKPAALIGRLRGRIRIHGDILSTRIAPRAKIAARTPPGRATSC